MRLIKTGKMNVLRNIMFAVFLLTVISTAQSQNTVKQVRGTFINFVYQDERNKYMNPEGIDATSPKLWRLKVKELSEMGIEYIVLLFVAIEGKSFYPSDFLLPAYPLYRESPVDAIMNAADEYNMKVFMSTGWAKNQDDNPGLQQTRAIQKKIMHETAKLYSKHKSFYGWYLPCEGVIGPSLSQYAVDEANELTTEAKSLTPDAKVMISPYGLRLAKFDDGVFAEQIGKLKVDIIGYQDEIGCVTEPAPMIHMKENFSRLREVHNKTGIALWANCESFTWEKGLNVRPSALIPAPFARYLSQITGVSKAGVDEIISFAVCGIYDKPDSEIPIGHPLYAGKAYNDYMNWKNGTGRWKLLEASFWGELKHDAINKPVSYAFQPATAYSYGNLTDGKFGAENYTNKNWMGFEKTDLIATVDLGGRHAIKKIAVRFLAHRLVDIYLPKSVDFSVSGDGINFTVINTVQMDQYLNDKYDSWIDMAVTDDLNENARYIRIKALNDTGHWIFADEILVNPDY